MKHLIKEPYLMQTPVSLSSNTITKSGERHNDSIILLWKKDIVKWHRYRDGLYQVKIN